MFHACVCDVEEQGVQKQLKRKTRPWSCMWVRLLGVVYSRSDFLLNFVLEGCQLLPGFLCILSYSGIHLLGIVVQ